MISTYRIAYPSRTIPVRGGGSVIAPPLTKAGTVFTDPGLAPPESQQSFNLDFNQAITGANTTYAPAQLQYKIPDNCYGFIQAITLLLNGITLSSNVLWQLQINGVPVQGFNAMTILGRDGAASVTKAYDSPLRIAIPVGGQVSIVITNVDGASYTAGTSVYGYFMPQTR